MSTPLISAPALRALMASGAPLLIFDCRFDLSQPEQGAASYLECHLPGAQYLHLDRDLSAPRVPGVAAGGRHPLPTREAFAALMAARGCQDDLPVVAYDHAAAGHLIRHGVNGLLARFDDQAEYCRIARKAIADREGLRAIGVQARKDVLQLDWARIIEAIESEYAAAAGISIPG